MSMTVVGSIAFDAVKTPFGARERMLGGSAVHFSLAASFFTDVRVVGPVGDDFGDEELTVLHARNVETSDIERVAGGETFFWAGEYEYDLNGEDARHPAQRVRRVPAQALRASRSSELCSSPTSARSPAQCASSAGTPTWRAWTR